MSLKSSYRVNTLKNKALFDAAIEHALSVGFVVRETGRSEFLALFGFVPTPEASGHLGYEKNEHLEEMSLEKFFSLTPEDIQPEPEEMTMEQIEKELGRKIKIVK